MCKSGCIVFGPDGFGSAEILASDDLLFKNIEDAHVKIERVTKDEAHQQALRAHLEARAAIASAGLFCEAARAVVATFLEESASANGRANRPATAREAAKL
jgi:hypothetical protein